MSLFENSDATVFDLPVQEDVSLSSILAQGTWHQLSSTVNISDITFSF